MISVSATCFRELVLIGVYAYKLYRSDEDLKKCKHTDLGTVVPRVLRALRDMEEITDNHITTITSNKGAEYQRSLEIIVEYQHSDYLQVKNKETGTYKDEVMRNRIILSTAPLVVRFNFASRTSNDKRRIMLVNTMRLHCSEFGLRRAKQLLQGKYPHDIIGNLINKYADEDAYFAEMYPSTKTAMIRRSRERFYRELAEA